MSPDVGPEELSFDEAVARYYRQWILMKVTAFDEYHWPARGVVLFHSPDPEAVAEEFAKQLLP